MSTRCVVVLLLSFLVELCIARQTYVARIPNGQSIPGVAALGHINPAGGGPRNVFGVAFEKAGFAWTVALCLEDSDGDGATNGQELGDPCCVWHKGDIPTFATGTSHPGNASSTIDKTMLLQWVCGYHSSKSWSGSDASGEGANPANEKELDPTTSNTTTETPCPPTSTASCVRAPSRLGLMLFIVTVWILIQMQC